MYAQTARSPRFSYCSPQSLRGFHRGVQKGFHFQNESCDCIKYLNLGDELGYDVELVYKKKQVDMQNA